MSKVNKLLSLIMGMSSYVNEHYENIITDEEVNDCLLMLYFCMMTSDLESDKFYKSFKEKYNKLNEEQKEIAKKEITKILDIEYEPKIKKKEKRRDE